MKGLWAGAVCLSLGGWLAAAEDVQWRPAAPPGAVPSAAATPLSASVRLGAPVVTLGRPVVSGPAPRDAQIQRTSFSVPDTDPSRPLVRLQAPDSSPRLVPHTGPLATEVIGLPAHGSMFAVGAQPGTPPESTLPTPTPLPPVPGTTPPPGFTAFTGTPAVDDASCYPEDGPAPCCGWYASADYLLWWIRKDNWPVLVSVGPTGSNGIINGTLNTASPLFDGGGVENGPFNGGRVTLGYEFDPCKHSAVEGTFFGLGERSVHFLAGTASFNSPMDIGRPFTSLNTVTTAVGTFGPGPFAELVSSPPTVSGTVQVRGQSQLYGAEANYRCTWCEHCWGRIDWLAGFRYVNLEENVTISEDTFSPAQGIFTGNTTTPTMEGRVVDSFATRNQFYGGQVGLEYKYRSGDWELDLLGKIALGATYESVNIAGHTTAISNGGVVPGVAPGGLLALPSNSGLFTRTRFAALGEVGINVGYYLTDNLQLRVGYTYLGWSNVLRPGDQIDTRLNVQQIPSAIPPINTVPISAPVGKGPLVPMRETSFWAQGINLGLAYRF